MNYNYIYVKTNSLEKPSFFIGSTLRGAFGHKLKEDVCIEPSYECNKCAYQNQCLYYDFYESDEAIRSFRFDIGLDAKNYDFGLYIFGNNISRLRTIVKVLNHMLRAGTIASKKLSFPKSEMFLDGKKLFFDDKETLLPFKVFSQTLTFDSYLRDITLKLQTPCLIKLNGKLKKEVTLEDIVSSVYKRKTYFESKQIVYKLHYIPSYTLHKRNLHDITTTRRSDRQKKSIVLDGVTGEFIIKNLDPESYMLLKWGEVLGAGNKTVFGHGGIKIY